jgi:hypothetical protein
VKDKEQVMHANSITKSISAKKRALKKKPVKKKK